MNDTTWIGPDERLQLGDVGFLVEISHTMRNSERFELRDLPAFTNHSHRPTLTGWCGTTSDIACYAHGMAKVVRVARNGRALVQQIDGAELATALEELGFPELMPVVPDRRHGQAFAPTQPMLVDPGPI